MKIDLCFFVVYFLLFVPIVTAGETTSSSIVSTHAFPSSTPLSTRDAEYLKRYAEEMQKLVSDTNGDITLVVNIVDENNKPVPNVTVYTDTGTVTMI